METKNEPKTLEEANYREPELRRCKTCRYRNEWEWSCDKFKKEIAKYGVCDCYG